MSDVTVGRRATPAELALAVSVLVGLFVRLGAGELFPNVLWPDEIFQSVEQAHRLVFGYGIVPWEFRDGARSWLLPGALAAVMRIASVIRDDPDTYLGAVRSSLVALSLLPIVAAWAWGRRVGRSTGALVAAGAVAVWFELVYMAPKALSEVVAAHVLIAALLTLDGRGSSRWRALGGAALVGLAVALRIHLAPAAAVVLGWTLWRERRGAALVLAGCAAPMVAAGALDLVTWGTPFHSYWTTIRANLIEGKGDSFGVLPWPAYGWMLRGVWGAGVLPLLALAALGARRNPVLLATACAVLATHSAIGHKEWRFVYPAIVLLVILAAIGSADVVERCRARWPRTGAVVAAALLAAWAGGSVARAVRFDSAATLQREDPPFSHWTARSALLRAFDGARAERELCGLGLVGLPWFSTGGYSRLHRDVPIYLVRSEADRRRLVSSYDVWIAPPAIGARSAAAAVRCWDDSTGPVCLYRRAGGCTSAPGYSVNEVIEQRGQ